MTEMKDNELGNKNKVGNIEKMIKDMGIKVIRIIMMIMAKFGLPQC